MKLFGLEMPAVFDEIRNTLQDLKLDFTTKEREDGGKTFEVSYNGGKVQVDMGKDLFDFRGIKITADDTTKEITEKIRESIKKLDAKGDRKDPAEYYYAWEKEKKPIKRVEINVVDCGFNEGVFGGGAITGVWISPWFEKFLIDRFDLFDTIERRELGKIDPMTLWKHLLSSESIPGITLKRRFYPLLGRDPAVYAEDEESEDLYETSAKDDSFVEIGVYTLPAKKQIGMIWYRTNVSVSYWNGLNADVRGGKIYTLRCATISKVINKLTTFLTDPLIIDANYCGNNNALMVNNRPLSKEEQFLLDNTAKHVLTTVYVPALNGYSLGAAIAHALSYQMMAEQISSIEKELGFNTWYPDEDRQVSVILDHIDIVREYVKKEYELDKF